MAYRVSTYSGSNILNQPSCEVSFDESSYNFGLTIRTKFRANTPEIPSTVPFVHMVTYLLCIINLTFASYEENILKIE
jgi:hypothetical protein